MKAKKILIVLSITLAQLSQISYSAAPSSANIADAINSRISDIIQFLDAGNFEDARDFTTILLDNYQDRKPEILNTINQRITQKRGTSLIPETNVLRANLLFSSFIKDLIRAQLASAPRSTARLAAPTISPTPRPSAPPAPATAPTAEDISAIVDSLIGNITEAIIQNRSEVAIKELENLLDITPTARVRVAELIGNIKSSLPNNKAIQALEDRLKGPAATQSPLLLGTTITRPLYAPPIAATPPAPKPAPAHEQKFLPSREGSTQLWASLRQAIDQNNRSAVQNIIKQLVPYIEQTNLKDILGKLQSLSTNIKIKNEAYFEAMNSLRVNADKIIATTIYMESDPKLLEQYYQFIDQLQTKPTAATAPAPKPIPAQFQQRFLPSRESGAQLWTNLSKAIEQNDRSAAQNVIEQLEQHLKQTPLKQVIENVQRFSENIKNKSPLYVDALYKLRARINDIISNLTMYGTEDIDLSEQINQLFDQLIGYTVSPLTSAPFSQDIALWKPLGNAIEKNNRAVAHFILQRLVPHLQQLPIGYLIKEILDNIQSLSKNVKTKNETYIDVINMLRVIINHASINTSYDEDVLELLQQFNKFIEESAK